MAATFYERHRPRHRAWSKDHVPAIREAFKDALSVARRMNLSRLRHFDTDRGVRELRRAT